MSKPAKCISVTEAKELYNNWMSTRAPALSTSVGSQDASDFIWSVAELEAFIAYVKEESANQGVSDPGIRVHFAAYDSSESTKATVFLAATKGASANAAPNYDIEPFNRAGTGWPPNSY